MKRKEVEYAMELSSWEQILQKIEIVIYCQELRGRSGNSETCLLPGGQKDPPVWRNHLGARTRSLVQQACCNIQMGNGLGMSSTEPPIFPHLCGGSLCEGLGWTYVWVRDASLCHGYSCPWLIQSMMWTLWLKQAHTHLHIVAYNSKEGDLLASLPD
jgi:hypothetical protein